jgi:hypothetical protein
MQAIPIGQLDPTPKRTWKKKDTHGKATARALTSGELAQQRQREEDNHQAQLRRIQEEALIVEIQVAANSQDSLFTAMPVRPTTPSSI